MSGLFITLLGAPNIEVAGKTVALVTRRNTALVAYLAVARAPQTRDALATLLWPDMDAVRSRNYLRQALWQIKHAVGAEWFVLEGDTVGLNWQRKIGVDVRQFAQLLTDCHAHGHPPDAVCADCAALLQQAVALYHNDFLAGFTIPGSATFDEWQFFQTEAYRRQLADALEKLVHFHTAQAAFAPALTYARQWLMLDPLHELVHHHLMQLYADAGQQSAALRQYQECERLLKTELGSEPAVETQALYAAIRTRQPRASTLAVAAMAQPVALLNQAPLLPSGARSQHNLPVQPTPFVGRQTELRQIGECLLDATCRLLTIVGPGGAGKTRLAIEAAGAQVAQFPQGIRFVPLASVVQPTLLATTILEAIGAPPAASEDLQDHLLHFLSDKKMLVVLDNFEHLLEGVGLCVEMLARAPGIKLLITSRTRLDIRAEWLVSLQGMPLATDAIELFVQSVRRINVNFSLSEEDRLLVARICQLLDRLPLSIELAATWSRLLSLAAIAREIEQSLDFLTTTLRDLPERHRSLRAVFESSWRQLSTREQQCLCHLAHFHGGFQAEATATVADAVLLDLAGLVDKSWLQVTPTGRYQMHALIRQFCGDKLAEDAREVVQDRHGHYFADFLRMQTPRLVSRMATETLQTVLLEINNIRAAWAWAAEQCNIDVLADFIEPLRLIAESRGWFHEIAGMYNVAIARLHKALSNEEEGATAYLKLKLTLIDILLAKAMIHWYAGQFLLMQQLCEEATTQLQGVPPGPAYKQRLASIKSGLSAAYDRQGEYEIAERLNEEVITLFAELGDDRSYTMVLMGRAICDVDRGRVERAIDDFQKCLHFFTRNEDVIQTGTILQRLGVAYWHQGDYSTAEQYLHESLHILQAANNAQGAAGTLMVLGNVATSTRKFEQAMQYYQTCLAYANEGNILPLQTNTLNRLATAELVAGQQTEAEAHYNESLTIANRIIYPYGRINALIGLGDVATLRGEYRQAQRCYLDALTDHAEPVQQLDALLGLAQLLQWMEQPEHAVELLGVVLQHAATHHDTKYKAQSMLADLASILGTDKHAAALQRGKMHQLNDIVVQIRKEFT